MDSPNRKDFEFIEKRKLITLGDTQLLARDLVPKMSGKQVIGLKGPMGSGKTHFVKALAKELGVPSELTNSPSYSIHNEYQGLNKIIHHIDLYRLDSDDEIESSGFWDLFFDDQVLIAVEWIDRIPITQIPLNFSYFEIEFVEVLPEHRIVEIYRRR